MPFIPVNLNEAEEAKPVENGRYDLVINAAENTKSKAGKDMIKVTLNIESHDDAPPVWHYVNIPDVSDDDGGKGKALMLRRFLDLFKIPYSPEGIDTDKLAEAMPGARANVELVLEEYNGNMSNKLLIPRLKSGPSDAGKGSPPKAKKA